MSVAFIRWYPQGESERHLKAFSVSGGPIWGSFSERAIYFVDNLESEIEKAKSALKACRTFHGADEDIVLVRLTRRRRSSQPSSHGHPTKTTNGEK